MLRYGCGLDHLPDQPERQEGTGAIGDLDAAIAYAEQAFDKRDPSVVLFGRKWKAARFLTADSRFVDILRRMRFPDWEEGETRP